MKFGPYRGPIGHICRALSVTYLVCGVSRDPGLARSSGNCKTPEWYTLMNSTIESLIGTAELVLSVPVLGQLGIGEQQAGNQIQIRVV